MAIYETHAPKSRSRDISGLFVVVVMLAVLAIAALDAYAFSTLNL